VRWLTPLWRRPRQAFAQSLDALCAQGFIAIDLETTGLDARRDRIVSLAAVPFVASEPASALTMLVNPGRPIPPSSTAIHGIDDAMVAEAPDEITAVRRLDAVCAGQVIVGHRVGFDLTVLARARGGDAGYVALCTQRLAVALHPAWSDVSLDGVCAAFGVSIHGRHTAEGDAAAAGRLLVRLVPPMRARGIRTVADALWLQESVTPG
jgi:DNA polymerase III epsilon subunit-like protein